MPGKTRPKPTTDHLQSLKKPMVVRDYFGVPEDIQLEFDAARRGLEAAKLRGESKDPEGFKEAQQRAEAARRAVRDNSLEVVMQSAGRRKWAELKAKHPAQQPGAILDENPDTFPVPAIALSVVQPEWSLEDVQEVWDSDEWNEAECARLLQMAYQVNQGRRTADLAF
jgi:hypothetical protein